MVTARLECMAGILVVRRHGINLLCAEPSLKFRLLCAPLFAFCGDGALRAYNSYYFAQKILGDDLGRLSASGKIIANATTGSD